METNGIIMRKFALMNKQLTNLEKVLAGIDKETFTGDWALRTIAERALQVCIEIMIDVAERIIALAGKGPVATAAEAIEGIRDMNVISSAETYLKMVKFRNLVVHAYEEIDPEILYEIAFHNLDDFRRFRDELLGTG